MSSRAFASSTPEQVRAALTFFSGRGPPPALTLSFGEIPWFDAWGEIQRYDWLKIIRSLEIHIGHMQKNVFSDQSQRCISRRTSNHGISPNDSASDSG